MTGFGSAEGSVLGGRLSIEIRSVNHRYFNPQLKLPFELAGTENQLRERLRRLLDRGHVTVAARWIEAPATESAVTVDLARARQVLAAAKQLKQQLKLKGEVDLAFVARHPDVLALERDGAAAEWNEVEPIVERAAQQLVAMRAREGAALATELVGRLDALAKGALAVERRAPVSSAPSRPASSAARAAPSRARMPSSSRTARSAIGSTSLHCAAPTPS